MAPTQTIPVMTLGWIGMITNVLGYGLQSFKTIRHKQVKSLSMKTFIQNFIGGMLWMWNSILTDTIQGSVAGVLILTAQATLFYFFALEREASKIKSGMIMSGLLALAWGSFLVSVLNKTGVITNLDVPKSVRLTIGITAAVFSSTAFIPQFIKMVRDKDVKDLSWGLLILSSLSQTIWVIFWGLRMNESIDMWVAGFTAGFLTGTCFYLLLITKTIIERKMKLDNFGDLDFSEIH